jgi:hypothetical protein
MQQFDINHVVKAIVERCQTEEEVYELLSGLASVNWSDAIAKKRYEDSLRPCHICREWKVMQTFSYIVALRSLVPCEANAQASLSI